MNSPAEPATFIHPDRVRRLNDRPWRPGRFVLYWMQQAQRAQDNPALRFACGQGQRLGLPVVVVFALLRRYPEATRRHFRFMLEGLVETEQALAAAGIPLLVRRGEPVPVVLDLAQQAAGIVCDRAYLPPLVAWRTTVAASASCAVWQVETELVVPADTASERVEVAARTLRPRIMRHLAEHLEVATDAPVQSADPPTLMGESLHDLDGLCQGIDADRTPGPVTRFFAGGHTNAERALDRFMRTALDGYAVRRRHPEAAAVSHLSPYLQYGQISAQRIAATVAARPGTASADRDAFLDELIVRRELAHNFTLRHPAWDRYEGIPAWARESLARHAGDPRPHVYDLTQLEAATTHDPYWNAAMTEARLTGYMHNHLRMYWGKKILEWSPDAQTAHARCLYLNNRYFLDGLSPNSYANVGWLFGLHDRPWPERPIFGTVRYMNAAGLERKCDIAAYVAGIRRLAVDDIKPSRNCHKV